MMTACAGFHRFLFVAAPSDKPLILAIDQGSTFTKALVVDPGSGTILASGRAPVEDLRAESLIRSVRAALRNISSKGKFRRRTIVVAIANQRSTLCCFDAAGLPRGKVVPWWDRSGLSTADVTSSTARRFQELTGLPLLPNWWGGKLGKTARRDAPGLRYGTVDTLLLAWLTGGASFMTDISNAARTGLVDVRRGRRSPALAKILGVPPAIPLAEVRSSLDDFGALDPSRIGLAGRIHAVLGDAGASLMGATGGRAGVLCLTLGTGAFLHMPLPGPTTPPDGLYLAPAWKARRRVQWTFEAAIPAMSAALAEGLAAAGLRPGMEMRIAPRSPRKRLDAFLLPSGGGALGPDWSGIRLEGAWRTASPEEKLGALYEGLALLVARGIRHFPSRPGLIAAGGGLSRSPFLLQAIADLSGVPVAPLREAETTAWGVARLAAIGLDAELPHSEFGPVLSSRLGAKERRIRQARFESLLQKAGPVSA